MSATIPADRCLSANVSAPVRAIESGLRPLDIMVLSAWCGLASGLLEAVARCLAKSYFATNQLYLMSRHFTWLAPLSDLVLFSAVGLVLALTAKRWPRFGRWFGPRLIGFLAILPVFMVLSPRIYPMAWVLLASGTSVRLASFLERHADRAPVAFPEFSRLTGLGRGPGRLGRRRRMAGRAPRSRPPESGRRSAERAFDHLGHRSGRPSEPIRLWTSHLSGAGTSGQPGHSLRRGTCARPVDPPLTREHVHRTLAPRAERRLDDAAQHETLRPWPSISGRAVMQRRDSWPISSLARTTAD